MSRRTLAILLASIAFCLLCYSRGEQDPYARYTLEGFEKIDRLALDQVPDRELFQGAMQGMVAVLNSRGDEHTQFITEREAKMFREELSQEIGGIGVRMRFTGDPPVLEIAGPPIPGKPAARAGIHQGDRVIAIDGELTAGLGPRDFETILEHMRGRPHQPLELTILHVGAKEPEVLHLVREKMTLDSVRGDRLLTDQSWQYLLDQDQRIALVRLVAFGAKSVSELEELLPKLQAKGMEAMILDLRENPGGPLDAAVQTCELFLPPGKPIVETRDRAGEPRDISISSGSGPYVDLPLVVLVNRDSASASEIVAACLQDDRRAVVCGERSYGKGTVQILLPIQAAESLLKLTTASFWRPSGKNIHRMGNDRAAAMSNPDWGVTPDAGLDVPMTDEEYIALAKRRAERDVTVFDPADTEAEPELYDDPVVDMAVAHLEEQLDRAPEQSTTPSE